MPFEGYRTYEQEQPPAAAPDATRDRLRALDVHQFADAARAILAAYWTPKCDDARRAELDYAAALEIARQRGWLHIFQQMVEDARARFTRAENDRRDREEEQRRAARWATR